MLLFDLPPGAERTVQYADYLGPRTSFVLVTIPSEVARGVVARSVAALSKRPNRLLGYVEKMSGYYCRDCNAIKPLFASADQPPPGLRRPAGAAANADASAEADASAQAEHPALRIPCLGTVPFDPELARHCDRGLPLAELPDTPAGRALAQIAHRLLDSLESTAPASAQSSRELRPGKEPRR